MATYQGNAKDTTKYVLRSDRPEVKCYYRMICRIIEDNGETCKVEIEDDSNFRHLTWTETLVLRSELATA